MSLKMSITQIDGVLILEPKIFGDDRGFFYESFNEKRFCSAIGRDVNFVQDNHSRSQRSVLRGMHYQIKQAQGKLIRVLKGSIYDVVVDIREDSPTFGDYVGVELSAANRLQIWVPEWCAHGFLTTSDSAEVLYKTTDYYAPEYERCIAWDDPDIGIDWCFLSGKPILSQKDSLGVPLNSAELFRL